MGNNYSENHVADVRGVNIWGPYCAAACGKEADFIVALRNAFPLLRQRIEELEAQNAKLREALERISRYECDCEESCMCSDLLSDIARLALHPERQKEGKHP